MNILYLLVSTGRQHQESIRVKVTVYVGVQVDFQNARLEPDPRYIGPIQKAYRPETWDHVGGRFSAILILKAN